MSWQLNNLKYGWMILASITLGTTIYIVNNERQKVRPEDIVELTLGVTECCLATQYSTNPVSYYVSPPSFVRSWYSNSYETTNVPGDLVTNWTTVLHTNIFTNVFGVRLDRAMMVSLDTTIKALVPYYCDPNTVYDGTTNITMLTVTGLWASLGIGDGTNQFTSVPEWVGTNGVTNAATYGDYPWRIYKTDLEERYKVLNALKYRRFGDYNGTSFPEVVKTVNVSGYGVNKIILTPCDIFIHYFEKIGVADGTEFNVELDNQFSWYFGGYDSISFGGWSSPPYQSRYVQIMLISNGGSEDTNTPLFSANLTLDASTNIIRIVNCVLEGADNPEDTTNSYTSSSADVSAILHRNVQGSAFFNVSVIIDFPFNYCTNAYWE